MVFVERIKLNTIVVGTRRCPEADKVEKALVEEAICPSSQLPPGRIPPKKKQTNLVSERVHSLWPSTTNSPDSSCGTSTREGPPLRTFPTNSLVNFVSRDPFFFVTKRPRNRRAEDVLLRSRFFIRDIDERGLVEPNEGVPRHPCTQQARVHVHAWVASVAPRSERFAVSMENRRHFCLAVGCVRRTFEPP